MTRNDGPIKAKRVPSSALLYGIHVEQGVVWLEGVGRGTTKLEIRTWYQYGFNLDSPVHSRDGHPRSNGVTKAANWSIDPEWSRGADW